MEEAYEEGTKRFHFRGSKCPTRMSVGGKSMAYMQTCNP
jgi:hypothetical protein